MRLSGLRPALTRTAIALLLVAGLVLAVSPPATRAAGFPLVEVTAVDYDATLGHNIPSLVVVLDRAVHDVAFWDFYQRTGGLTRWGYPTSEVFEETSRTLSQYYQRGVLDWKPTPAGRYRLQRRLVWDFLGGGTGGAPDLGVEPTLTNPHAGAPTGPWAHKVSNWSIEGQWVGFQDAFKRLGGVDALGYPKSEARRDDHPQAVLRMPGSTPGFVRQYFQAGVLEFHPDAAQPVKLALLGDLIRDRQYPAEAWRELVPFQRAAPLAVGMHRLPVVTPAGTSRVSFTAAGDYGTTLASAATLRAIAGTDASFHLALGDLSYGHVTPETAWCDYVKALVGPTLPFQLVAGNHDTTAGSHIREFARCLPDRLGAVGDYPLQYYLDIQGLVRIIVMSPGILLDGAAPENETSGASHRWVANTIDEARTASIPWVIVAMHRGCLSAERPGCEIGSDLVNLLIAKRVDLVLRAHDHSYQRSGQLRVSATCPRIEPTSFNAHCLISDPASRSYTKGEGTILLTVGTAGRRLRNIDPNQPDAGFFATWMGANVEPTHGFVRVAVTATDLTAYFMPTTPGEYRDWFAVISGRDA